MQGLWVSILPTPNLKSTHETAHWRNPVNVDKLVKPTEITVSLKHTKEFILERNPMNVWNIGKTSNNQRLKIHEPAHWRETL